MTNPAPLSEQRAAFAKPLDAPSPAALPLGQRRELVHPLVRPQGTDASGETPIFPYSGRARPLPATRHLYGMCIQTIRIIIVAMLLYIYTHM